VSSSSFSLKQEVISLKKKWNEICGALGSVFAQAKKIKKHLNFFTFSYASLVYYIFIIIEYTILFLFNNVIKNKYLCIYAKFVVYIELLYKFKL